jgi:hypothetical protein
MIINSERFFLTATWQLSCLYVFVFAGIKGKERKKKKRSDVV